MYPRRSITGADQSIELSAHHTGHVSTATERNRQRTCPDLHSLCKVRRFSATSQPQLCREAAAFGCHACFRAQMHAIVCTIRQSHTFCDRWHRRHRRRIGRNKFGRLVCNIRQARRRRPQRRRQPHQAATVFSDTIFCWIWGGTTSYFSSCMLNCARPATHKWFDILVISENNTLIYCV